jgi:hypothetical protein
MGLGTALWEQMIDDAIHGLAATKPKRPEPTYLRSKGLCPSPEDEMNPMPVQDVEHRRRPLKVAAHEPGNHSG